MIDNSDYKLNRIKSQKSSEPKTNNNNIIHPKMRLHNHTMDCEYQINIRQLSRHHSINIAQYVRLVNKLIIISQYPEKKFYKMTELICI